MWEDEDYNDYWRTGPGFEFVAIADVDGDGEKEVVATASDTLVHCINSQGKKKWSRSIGDEPDGLVVLEAGIVAGSRTGEVHLLDGRGERLWRVPVGGVITGMCGSGTGVCTATVEGELVWLQSDGQVAAWATGAEQVVCLLDAGEGKVLAGCANGRVLLASV